MSRRLVRLALGVLSVGLLVGGPGGAPPAQGRLVIEASAGITLTKQGSPNSVAENGALTYTLTVANEAAGPADDVQLDDNLPAPLAGTPTTTEGSCDVDGQLVTCSLGTLASGAEAVVTIPVTAPDSPGLVTNAATATSSIGDASATTSTCVFDFGCADLAIRGSSPERVLSGGEVTHHFEVSNAGPDAVHSIVRDLLPPGAEFIETSDEDPCAPISGQPSTIRCDLGVIAPGNTTSFSVTFTLPGSLGTFESQASVFAVGDDVDGGDDPLDPNEADNSVALSTAITSLELTKTDSPDPVAAGERLTYTITVRTLAARDSVTVIDHLPASVQFESATPSTCVHQDKDVVCEFGTLGSDATRTVTIGVTPQEPGTISNAATVTGEPIIVEVAPPTIAAAAALDMNTATVLTEVLPVADLEVVKADSPDPVLAGDRLTYTVTLRNHGPHAAPNVVLSDQLPTDVTFESATLNNPTGNCMRAGVLVTCAIPTVAVNEDVRLTIVAAVPPGVAPKTLLNTAFVPSSCGSFGCGGVEAPTSGPKLAATGTQDGTSDGPVATWFDPNPGNDSDTEETTVTNLAITKSDTPDPVPVGQALTYTVEVGNRGTAATDENSVFVTDTLPSSVNFVSATASQGTCQSATGGTVTCALGALDAAGSAGDHATVTIRGVPTEPGTIENTASVERTCCGGVEFAVTPAQATGSVVDSNTARETTTVIPSVDLTVTKADSPDPVDVGQSLTYTIEVANTGQFPADNVTVDDDMPGTVQVGTAASSAGTCTVAANHIKCALGTLPAQSQATITITGVPTQPGSVTNTAQVASSTFDPDGSNNADSEETLVASADLAVVKTASPSPVLAGNNLSYVVRVTNAGPARATEVSLIDEVPAGTTFISAAPSQGSCGGPPSLTCDLGTIDPGAEATVVVVVVPTAPGNIVNTATVASATNDPEPANNSASATTAVTDADLRLTKSVSPAKLLVGERLTYRLVVTNPGTHVAQNVRLVDELPDGTDAPVASASRGRCFTGRIVTCSLGSLGPGRAVTVTIAVTAGRAGVLANVASVATATFESDRANNTASAQASADFAPALALVPALGPPGFVTSATGTGFPANAVIALKWQPGLGRTSLRTTARGDFRVPMLVFDKDRLGPRRLIASSATTSGGAFDPVAAGFLVVPASIQPPDFARRR
jgi:uncharacterized repeat protein (TIGR01451 family)